MGRFERGGQHATAPATRRRGRARRPAPAVRGRLDPHAAAETIPDRPGRGRGRRRADRLDGRPASARRGPRELTAGLSPDTELTVGGFYEPAAATPGAPAAAGHPRRLRSRLIGAAPPPKAARDAAGDRRLALDPARHRARPAAGGRRDRGDPRPASRHRDLELGPRRLGRALDRAGGRRQPDAVVVFIGANEGYAMPGPGGQEVKCCGPDWAAVYANRVRQVMDNYRRDGAARSTG